MDSQNNRKYPNILISGTPGVGKTSFTTLLQSRISDEKNYQMKNINLGEIVNEKKLYKNWNKEFNVPEFDEDMVCDYLENLIEEGGCLLDFHSAGFLPEDWVDLIVLLRCNNTELYDRLKERGYNEKKITENIECEIMEVTADDVKENFNSEKIMELKSEVIDDMEKNLDIVMDKINELHFFEN
jgi:adenylate kinase